MKKKFWVLGILVCFCALFVLAGCGDKDGDTYMVSGYVDEKGKTYTLDQFLDMLVAGQSDPDKISKETIETAREEMAGDHMMLYTDGTGELNMPWLWGNDHSSMAFRWSLNGTKLTLTNPDRTEERICKLENQTITVPIPYTKDGKEQELQVIFVKQAPEDAANSAA